MPRPRDTQKSQMPHPRDLQGTQMEFDALYLDEILNVKKGKRKKLWIYKSFHRKYFTQQFTIHPETIWALCNERKANIRFVCFKREQEIYIKPFER